LALLTQTVLPEVRTANDWGNSVAIALVAS